MCCLCYPGKERYVRSCSTQTKAGTIHVVNQYSLIIHTLFLMYLKKFIFCGGIGFCIDHTFFLFLKFEHSVKKAMNVVSHVKLDVLNKYHGLTVSLVCCF